MELFGYIKANKLTSEYILRQDMQEKGETITISINDYMSKQFNINSKEINIKTAFFINENNIGISKSFEKTDSNYKNWASISSKLSGNQIDTILNDYKSRTKLIDTIIDKVIENNINGIVIDFNKDQQKESVLRFVIEIAPRLREFGITTAIVLNENSENNDYINIVDYIVE
ncbi:MAG: hypothetical protein IJB90_04870 [Clostridia bacterium]|nr:hypothetical protein [Clostridia bacterium]